MSAGMGLFIDWGATVETKAGQENGTLNALRIGALQCAGEVAAQLGMAERETYYAAEADRVTRLYRERLWLPDDGRFAIHTRDGQPNPADAAHANVVALAFGLADAAQEPALTEYVIMTLNDNARRARDAGEGSGHLELYFLNFAFRALERIGRDDIAVQVIRDHYQPMMDANARTIWECLSRGLRGTGSLCHAWSLSAMIYLFDTRP